MSEPKLTSAVGDAIEPPKTFLQKLLDGVERVGNKVPHPAVIFFILLALVILRLTCFTGWEQLLPTKS
jgi:p-aminobenzoyl-glutamate transporter AbgT